MKNIHIQILLLSVTTFILFGFTDALFFGIFLNEGLSTITANNSDIMVGALSASVALVMTTYIKKYNKQLFGELIEHPALDIFGILVGTYLYILVVREYRKLSI